MLRKIYHWSQRGVFAQGFVRLQIYDKWHTSFLWRKLVPLSSVWDGIHFRKRKSEGSWLAIEKKDYILVWKTFCLIIWL